MNAMSKSAAFVAANRRSPVVYGSVVDQGGKGCVYRLEDGSTWTLTRSECTAIGHPRWKHMGELG